MRADWEPRTVAEALAYLEEEAGEVLSALGKTGRHGLESTDPTTKPGDKHHGETNRLWVLREIADLKGAIARAEFALTAEGGRLDLYDQIDPNFGGQWEAGKAGVMARSGGIPEHDCPACRAKIALGLEPDVPCGQPVPGGHHHDAHADWHVDTVPPESKPDSQCIHCGKTAGELGYDRRYSPCEARGDVAGKGHEFPPLVDGEDVPW